MRKKNFLVAVAILVTLVGTLFVPKDVSANPPADYRVPVVGAYRIERMDCGNHVGDGRFMDINGLGGGSTDRGDPIYASGAGNITIGDDGAHGYGKYVLLESNGVTFRYAHLDRHYVWTGKSAVEGELLGLLGNTGHSTNAHLHWEGWYTTQGPDSNTFNIFEIPGVNEDGTPCSGQNDGSIDGDPLPLNQYESCEAYASASANAPHVALFDKENCQGNLLRLSGITDIAVNYYLNGSTKFNDRTRSIYVPAGWSVNLGAHVWDEPRELTACLFSTEDDLDDVKYAQDQSVAVGFDDRDGHRDGYDMASYAVVNKTAQCVLGAQAISSYAVGQGGQSGNPTWLLEFAKSEKLPFDVQLHVKVDAGAGVYDAHRVLMDGTVLYESSAPEYYYAWNTYGIADGQHTLKVQYRRLSDGGNWASALVHEENFYLSTNRSTFAPCGTNAEGARLSSGVDCIIATGDVADLANAGWSDRSEMYIQVTGDYEAWAYESVDFQGGARVVKSGQTLYVGNNISSIVIKPLSPPPPPNPTGPFTVDANTRHLYHFDQGYGGATIYDTAGSLNGSKQSGAWITNDLSASFDKAVQFSNPPDGQAINFGAMENICPMTWQGWISLPSGSSGGRISGQLGEGGNTGQNKWLLSMTGIKPQVEVWSGGGSQIAYSYKEVNDGWNYLMFTYDCNTSLKLYLNNELVGETTTAGVWNGGSTTFEIGAAEGIGRFNGSIDEVRILDAVRVPGDSDTPIPSTPIPSPTLAATATATPNPNAPLIVDTNTVHLYRFNENTGNTVYDSAGTLNGIKAGESIAWITNDFDPAYQSALQFYNPPNTSGLTFASPGTICPFTIEAMVRSTSGGAVAGQTSGAHAKWLLYVDNGYPLFQIYQADGNWKQITSSTSIANGAWHKLMVTYDCANAAKLYVDGVLVAQGNDMNIWNPEAVILEVGSAWYVYRFNGSIDEVRLSNTIRTP